MSKTGFLEQKKELITLVEGSALFMVVPDKKEEMIKAINLMEDNTQSRELISKLTRLFEEERSSITEALEDVKRDSSS